jgi:RNA recognition motif-containing protein
LATTSSLESKGFGWVTYSTHEVAIEALKNLKHKLKINDVKIQVNIAESRVIDERQMDNVKVLYVKNLPNSIQELQMIQLFGGIDVVEKAIIPFDKVTYQPQGHAFIHFKERKDALKALNELNGTIIDGKKILVELSIPQSIVQSKKKTTKTNPTTQKVQQPSTQQQTFVIPQFLPVPYIMQIPFYPTFNGFMNPIPMNFTQQQQQQQQILQFMYQQNPVQQETPKENEKKRKHKSKKYLPY